MPGRDAARESDARSRTRCRSGARQPIESETPESAISSESETPRSTTLGSMAPGSATLQNAIPESAMPGQERDARKRGALEHGIQKAHRCRPAEGDAEEKLSKEATTVRKRNDGASLQRNRSELSESAARGPLFRLPMTSNPALQPQNRRSQLSPAPNSPIPPEQHACNKAPLWRFLTKEAREGAVPGTRPPGLSHFPEKSAALFHVEGKTRERRRVRNASPAGKGDQLYEVKG